MKTGSHPGMYVEDMENLGTTSRSFMKAQAAPIRWSVSRTETPVRATS